MSRFRRFNMIDYYSPSSFFLTETSVFTPKPISRNPFFPSFPDESELDLALDLISPSVILPKPTAIFHLASPFADDFDATVTDLIRVDSAPFCTSTRKLVQRRYLQSLSDRVSALELGFDQLEKEKTCEGDRKYTWTTEIKSGEKDGVDRKYEWSTKIKAGKKKEKTYQWTAEIRGKGEDTRVYKFTAITEGAKKKEKEHEKEKDKSKSKSKKKSEKVARYVEIQEGSDHGTVVLRQAFAKRADDKSRGKRKELSPHDAAVMIQMSFRAYLIRRSQALRALRELAIAKAKLKEIRALFNNFSYRRRVARDAEERQRFTEKIIVLLLTVDAIEGADIMVRPARRSMVDELEAMLELVDPQPQGGRSLSLKRRTFDMPDGVIQKELAAGVAQVVRMLDKEPNGSADTFESCL